MKPAPPPAPGTHWRDHDGQVYEVIGQAIAHDEQAGNDGFSWEGQSCVILRARETGVLHVWALSEFCEQHRWPDGTIFRRFAEVPNAA